LHKFQKFVLSCHCCITFDRPSTLIAGLVQGSAGAVTRGKGQGLDLEPYLYSSDPDYPEMKVIYLLNCKLNIFLKNIVFQFSGLEFRYYCRQMINTSFGEVFNKDPDGNLTFSKLQSVPTTTPNGTLGGCFGLGPG